MHCSCVLASFAIMCHFINALQSVNGRRVVKKLPVKRRASYNNQKASVWLAKGKLNIAMIWSLIQQYGSKRLVQLAQWLHYEQIL